jgi:hypothetical protein
MLLVFYHSIENLHALNVLDGSHFFTVELVTANGVEMNLFTKSSILVLHGLDNDLNLLALEYFFIIHACDGVEYRPHYFGVVHAAEMVTNVKTENDFIQLCFLNTDALISKWRRQLSQEVR